LGDLARIQCDILIVGGTTGGTAAALAAASHGASVCLVEETNWLGGQLTTQGVSTPDEQNLIEQFGATRRYYEFRNAVRDYYRTKYKLTAQAATTKYFNPGNCWVAHFSFEPKVGADLLSEMVSPLVESGQLKIFFGTIVNKCVANKSDMITRVDCSSTEFGIVEFSPKYVLDATDLGDVLALAGIEGEDWVTGAEKRQQTGEPDAPLEARLDWVQPFTFPFALDWSPETKETNVICAPKDYDELKALQKYHIKHGAMTGLFEGAFPWWSYRRLLASENFDDPQIKSDLAMINTSGNDFYGGNVIGSDAGDSTKVKQTLERARQASLGYVYWLQTECPREISSDKSSDSSSDSFSDGFSDGSSDTSDASDSSSKNPRGYPEFRLRLDVFDTEDGCSIKPYIRESRRIRSLRPILEQEIVVADFKGNPCRGDNARAAFMRDSIGVGHYALDIHPNGHGETNAYVPTRPFQIPLGALIPVRLKNLLPACKNLGTTHLTNGAYRLHPIEWNIGESAGIIAALCVLKNYLPRDIYESELLTSELQSELLRNGIPLNWYVDVPLHHEAFKAVQMLACTGILSDNDTDLLFHPDELVDKNTWQLWSHCLGQNGLSDFSGTRVEAAIALYENTQSVKA
jgi:hypothetical protein